jgi:hypothetical protein
VFDVIGFIPTYYYYDKPASREEYRLLTCMDRVHAESIIFMQRKLSIIVGNGGVL